MKRYHAYLLLMIVVIAFAAPFIMPLKNGQPLLDWHNLALAAKTPPLIQQTLTTTLEPRHEPVKLLRWQDKNHQWHFSQSPPEDGTPYETVFVDPDNNVVSLPRMESASTTAPTSAPISNAEMETSPSPYSPSEISQLLQEASKAEALLRERHMQQEAELNGLAVEK